MTCDRCGDYANPTDLYCTACGDVAHGPCDDGDHEHGDVCGRCWAVLSHVEGEIDCASGCSCLRDYPEIADEIEEFEESQP